MTRSVLLVALLLTGSASQAPVPHAAIDAQARAALAATRAKGLAVAVIEDGQVTYVQAYGTRNAKGDPLLTDTVMYGASLTKTVMAYTALTLVDQGKLDLDAPLAGYLEKPLTSYGEGEAHLAKYGPYRDLAGDDRWRTITARMALTHSTGFHNFWFIEPDRKLRIHFDPGSRYSYSGEGFSLLQFTIEQGRQEQRPRPRRQGPDRQHFLAPGHDAHQPPVASGLPAEPGRRVERQGRAAGPRRTLQRPRRRLDGYHDQRSREVLRGAGAG